MTSRLLPVGVLTTSLLVLAGCQQPSGDTSGSPAAPAAAPSTITLDGSSTVYPISEAIAEEFQLARQGAARVTVGVSGTGGGFKKFCRGELDIANASRPISKEEMASCAAAGVRYYELPVAYDALTVVVNPQNTFLTEISIEQLKAIWQPEAQGQIMNWNQVDPSWPDQPLKLYGAGADSGTFDYFTEAVVGKAKASRGDFTASEDDNVLVQGVSSDINALGYFGYAFYAENKDKLKSLAIKPSADAPAVAPTAENVINGSYMPLARPMFVYVSEKAYQRAEVKDFMAFYFDNVAQMANETQYVPLPTEAYATIRQHLADGKLGTVFKGEPATAITIDELLRREAAL